MVLNILAPNDGFLLITTLKLNTFKVIKRVFCIISRAGAMKIRVSVRSSSWGNLSLFEITTASVLFSRKF